MKTTLALLALLSLLAQTVYAQTVDDRLLRGHALHDTICRGCHENDMYTKRHLSRNPYFDLRMQTRLWSEVVKEKWSDAEIDDVVYFLQKTYYNE